MSYLFIKYGVSVRHHFSDAEYVYQAEHEKYGKIGTYQSYITILFSVLFSALYRFVTVCSNHAHTYFWNMFGLSTALYVDLDGIFGC